MSSVAVGDGAVVSNGLTRYYAESGTPPGRFLGAGLAGLADGEGVEKGSVVTELHLYRIKVCCRVRHLRRSGSCPELTSLSSREDGPTQSA
jgi:hypothetical protein